jgi:hypothetical protein
MTILCAANPATEHPLLYANGLRLQQHVYEKVGYYEPGAALNPLPRNPFVGIYLVDETALKTFSGVTATVLGFDATQDISIENDFGTQLKRIREECRLRPAIYWGNFASIGNGGHKILLQALRISLEKDAHSAIIVVNPHDERIYNRMGFVQRGFVKNVGGLKNAPGYLMVINKETLKERFVTRTGVLLPS